AGLSLDLSTAKLPVINDRRSTNELEEITVVSALRDSRNKRGIRIHLSDPRSKPKPAPVRQIVPVAANENPFSLTLLGDTAPRKKRSVDHEKGDSFLSVYSSSIANNSSIIRRSATIGGGLVLLIAIFLFGGKFLKLDVLADRDREPIAETAVQNALPQQTDS